MKENLSISLLTDKHIPEIALLGQQLNPKLTLAQLEDYLREMFQFSAYRCFGLFQHQKLVGVSSGWITVRFYSGKQLEIDNVVIDQTLQSQGLGSYFLDWIENWARANHCKTIELNTYLQNAKSHKFYFNNGFTILGFHFWKPL